jgi:hypothetical protein
MGGTPVGAPLRQTRSRRHRRAVHGPKLSPQSRFGHRLPLGEAPRRLPHIIFWPDTARTCPRSPWQPGGHPPPSPEMLPLGRCPAQGRSDAAAARKATCILLTRKPCCCCRRTPGPETPPPAASLTHGRCPAAAPRKRTTGNDGAQQRAGWARENRQRTGSCCHPDGHHKRSRRPSPAFIIACTGAKSRAHRLTTLVSSPDPARTPPLRPWYPGGAPTTPPEMLSLGCRPAQGRSDAAAACEATRILPTCHPLPSPPRTRPKAPPPRRLVNA